MTERHLQISTRNRRLRPRGFERDPTAAAQMRTELGRVIRRAGSSDRTGCGRDPHPRHALLEGVPGIAKTLMVQKQSAGCWARLPACASHRPDAGGHSGTTILQPGTATFTFHSGPVFTDLSCRRDQPHAPAYQRSAGVHGRTPGDERCKNPPPASGMVHRLATQNPIDFEGTYPAAGSATGPLSSQDQSRLSSHAGNGRCLERHHGLRGAGLLDDAALSLSPRSSWAAARGRDSRRSRSQITYKLRALELVRRTREWPCWLSVQAHAQPSVLCVSPRPLPRSSDRDYLVPDRRKARRTAGTASPRHAQT